jgi:probable HAF family extracellular repeat protein
MKTLSVALLLMASLAFVLLGCSEKSVPPVSPTDQSAVASVSGAITSTTGFPMVDLGPSVNPKVQCAYGVNSSAKVVCQADHHAFLWSRQLGVMALGALGEPEASVANDINDRGQVAVSSWEPGTMLLRACLWSENGGLVNLGTLGDPSWTPDIAFSMAKGINNRGEIVGCTDNYAFLWTDRRGMVLLGPQWVESAAWDINDRGRIVGVNQFSWHEYHAVLWTDVGKMIDLGTLRLNSQALGINYRGQVVGGSSGQFTCVHERIGGGDNSVFDPTCLPFIWTEQNGMSQLPLLGGGAGCAEAINESGQVVGWSYTAANEVHAFVWTSNNGTKDLGTFPGDAESVAYGINNLGQVVGYSNPESGNVNTHHAVIWYTR